MVLCAKIFQRLRSKHIFLRPVKSNKVFTTEKKKDCCLLIMRMEIKTRKRYYHAGEKDSINQGWWPMEIQLSNIISRMAYTRAILKNGMKRKATQTYCLPCRQRTKRHRLAREWQSVYEFCCKDGRLYGLINPNLCYSLKNERGEFVKSE
jgi:hypothetical protein